MRKLIMRKLISLTASVLVAITVLAPVLAAGENVSSGDLPVPPHAEAPAPVPIDLDLTSTERHLDANHLVGNGPVNILRGGESVPITPGTALTPAERLAVFQVVRTGEQSIVLGPEGNAVGGSLKIGPKFTQYVQSLNVPAAVNVLTDFAHVESVNLVGNLVNAGNLYAVSSSADRTTGTISALNIVNQGLITNTIPAAVAGFAGTNFLTDLNLTAVENVINNSTIASSGNLSVIAGNAIENNALISAQNHLNLQATLGNIVNTRNILATAGNINITTSNLINTGDIVATAGNINIASATIANLLVNNAAGSLQALLGSINVGVGVPGSYIAGVDLIGGDLLAQAIEINRPGGKLFVDVNSLGGPVSLVGSDAQVHVASGGLNVASSLLSGDPVYTSPGNLALNLNWGDDTRNPRNSTGGQNFIALSGGDISISGAPSGATIDAGGALIRIAAGVTYSGTSVTGSSLSGGSINMGGINLTSRGGTVDLRADQGTSTGTGGNIDIGNISTASVNGSAGAEGSTNLIGPGVAGGNATNGVNGSNGGNVTITATNNVQFRNIGVSGGSGGAAGAGGAGTTGADGNNGSNNNGGNGKDGSTGGIGGIGGSGGEGGDAGSVTIIAGGQVSGLSIFANGGSGGAGGVGGAGGDGGDGGNGGYQDIPFTTGGHGGDGAAGAEGGDGGDGGSGGNGGAVRITGGTISVGIININGGIGANGGSGGPGGDGGQGGNGGDAYTGGRGGNGGAGGAGGTGGNAGTGGNGGAAGSFTIVATGSFTSNSTVGTGGNGGNGGIGGEGGYGGSAGMSAGGLSGGFGGDGGDGGTGGAGGGGGGGANGAAIDLSAFSVNAGSVSIFGGNGGSGGAGGHGQNAGDSTSGTGGFIGGEGGSGGDGGAASSGAGGGEGGDGGSLTVNSVQNITLTANINASGGNGGRGGRGGDGGSGTSGANGGGGLIGLKGGGGGGGSEATGGGAGGNGGDGGRVYLSSSLADISTRSIDTSGGAGGDGGDGGNGGDGGDGAESGTGLQGESGADYAEGGGVTASFGFSIGATGSSGGMGGFGANGGLGGNGGHGGDVVMLAPLGSINVDGDINTYGNNNGVQGLNGISGTNGKDGATNTYFGLSFDYGWRPSPLGPAQFGIGGSFTIANLNVGAVVWNGFGFSGPGLQGVTAHANLTNPDGTQSFNYVLNLSKTSVSQELTTPEYSVVVSLDAVRASKDIVNDLGVHSLVDFHESVAMGFSHGHFLTTEMTLPTAAAPTNTVTPILPGGTIGTTSSVSSTQSTSGGNISMTAGNSINVAGSINALGGRKVTFAVACCENGQNYLRQTYQLGPGGSLLMQAPSITVAGGTTPSSTVPTVGAGSMTFITEQDNANYLIKPIHFIDSSQDPSRFAQLRWTTQLGLNIGNGEGFIIGTNGATLIQNSNGSVDLSSGATSLFGSGNQYSVTGDLIVLATGNIIAPDAPAGAQIFARSGDGGRMGQIIMAAGDMAATRTYGLSDGQQSFVILGGVTDSGGAISLSNVSLGSTNTTLVFLEAHNGTASEGAAQGFIETGAITTSLATATSPVGSVYALSNSNIQTGLITTDYLSLANGGGSIGFDTTPVVTTASLISINSGQYAFVEATRPTVNLLSSSAGFLSVSASGDLTVLGSLNGHTINLESVGAINLRSTISADATSGFVSIFSQNGISDSVELGYINAPNIILLSNGSVNLSNSLTASNAIVINAGEIVNNVNNSTAALYASFLNAPYVGLSAGTGGITVNNTTAQNLFANSTGNVNIYVSNSVAIGARTGVYSLGNNFDLRVNGTITVTGPIQALSSMTLTAESGSNGSIILNKNLIAAQGVTLRADGFGNIQQTASVIQANTLTLRTDQGSIGEIVPTATGAVSNALTTMASSVRFESPGDVLIMNANPTGTDNLLPWSGRSLYFIALTGSVNVNAPLNGSNDIVIGAYSGNIQVNNAISAPLITLFTPDFSTTTSGSVVLNANLNSTGTIALASGSTGFVTLNAGKTIQADSIRIVTSTLNVIGNMTAVNDFTANSIFAGNALTVNFANLARITANSLNFNKPTATGSITIAGGTGWLFANNGNGSIQFNGGSSLVIVDMISMFGRVGGTGNPFHIRTRFSSLTAADINSSGDISLQSATALTALGSMSAAGTLGLTAPTININASAIAAGSYIDVLTRTLNLNGVLQATGTDLNIVSSNSDNSLIINLGLGSTLSAIGGIKFNHGVPGNLTMSGPGTLQAQSVLFNSGGFNINADVSRIDAHINAVASNVNIRSAYGDLLFASDVQVDGSIINIAATQGLLSGQNFRANASGMGNAAGSISLTGYSGIITHRIEAMGTAGAAAGSITLNSTKGTISATLLDASSNTSNGGMIDVDGVSVKMWGALDSNSAINVSSLSGAGGTVTITTTSRLNTLCVGCTAINNFIDGAINASGQTGGRINLFARAGLHVEPNGWIGALGTTGGGGQILIALASDPSGMGALNVANHGKIQATNEVAHQGIIAINTGAGQDLNMKGTGSLLAGEAVRAGNLSLVDLTLSPTAAGYGTINQANIRNSFESNLTITSLSLINPNGDVWVPSIDLGNANGNGGNLFVQATHSITMGNFNSDGSGPGFTGGAITLIAGDNILAGVLSAQGLNGANGGSINISAGNDIVLSGLSVDGANGGLLLGDAGNNFNIGSASFSSKSGNAGIGILNAGNDLTIASVSAFGAMGGQTTLTAGHDLNLGNANGDGSNGPGGGISLSAGSNIVFNTMLAVGTNASGGNISATTGNSIVGSLISADSHNGPGGTIGLTAPQILVGTLSAASNSAANGGTISVTGSATIDLATVHSDYSTAGTINISGPTLNALTLDAAGAYGGSINITSDTMYIDRMLAGGSINGGHIRLNGANITVQTIDVSGVLGDGGTITINGINVNTSRLNASAGGQGGAIEITADGTTSNGALHANGRAGGGYVGLFGNSGVGADLIDVSDPPFGNGGVVYLASNGVISVGSIFGTAESGNGGSLFVSAPTFTSSETIDFSSQSGRGGTVIINSNVIRLAQPINVRGREIGIITIANLETLQADLNPAFQTRMLSPQPGRGVQSQIFTGQAGRSPIDTTPVSRGLQNALEGAVSKDQTDDDEFAGDAAIVRVLDDDTPGYLSTHGVEATVSLNVITLDRGKILFYPNAPITVRTHEADVRIAAKSAVWVIETGNDVAVLDLSDNANGDVIVVTDKEHLELRPGQMIVLTRNLKAAFHEVNPAGSVTFRNVVPTDMGSGIKGYYGEFSIMSALQKVPQLRSIVSSTLSKDRKLAEKLLKNAAILMTVQRKSVAYRADKLLGASGKPQ